MRDKREAITKTILALSVVCGRLAKGAHHNLVEATLWSERIWEICVFDHPRRTRWAAHLVALGIIGVGGWQSYATAFDNSAASMAWGVVTLVAIVALALYWGCWLAMLDTAPPPGKQN